MICCFVTETESDQSEGECCCGFGTVAKRLEYSCCMKPLVNVNERMDELMELEVRIYIKI